MISSRNITMACRVALGGTLLCCLFLPAAAQSRTARWGDNSAAVEFTPRRTGDSNPNSENGYCNIRLEVDDEVYVYIRGDRVRAERTRGEIPRDQGSECTGPLPGRYLRNFRWRGVDGRGEQRLIEQPNSGNRYTAVAYIRDSKGGREGYTFRIEWEGRADSGDSWSGGGSGGNWGGSGGSGGWGSGGGSDWGSGGGGGWGSGGGGGWGSGGGGSTSFRAETSGNGTAYLQNDPNRNLNFARFHVNGDQFRLRLEGDVNIAVSGRVDRRGGGNANLTIDRINDNSASGGGSISIRNNEISRLSLNGDINGRSYRLNFNGK